jgi:3-oxoacyl-[acyl-carrier protein] reductase
MTDSYLGFANSALGSRIAAMLGLPQPLPLERYKRGQPIVKGGVLVGGGGTPQLLDALATVFKAIGAQTVAHRDVTQWMGIANQVGLMTGRWGTEDKPGEKVKALVFDATGMDDSSQADAIYRFFHDAARSVLPCGRVVVLGRPPEACASPRKATMQRALEGLTRSLAKELKRAITVQLVYVAEGAEDQLEGTLRFLLSPRSTYVSAQVVRIGVPVGPPASVVDWSLPLAGKKVLVTGASRGIGAAIAEVMARDGAQVICLDVPQAQAGLDEIAARLGAKALALDIGSMEAPQALVAAALLDGGWDVVVHNAGKPWSTSTCRPRSASMMRWWSRVRSKLERALCACRPSPALPAIWGKPTTPCRRPESLAWCRAWRRCWPGKASPSTRWRPALSRPK